MTFIEKIRTEKEINKGENREFIFDLALPVYHAITYYL